MINNNKCNMILLCGSSKSGKTYLMKYILKNEYRTNSLHKNDGLLFSGTKFTNQFYPLITKYIYDNSDDIESLLQKYLNYRKIIIENYGKIKKSYIIFDDMLANLKMKSTIITHLICNYRWYNLDVYILVQQCSTLGSVFKQQISKAYIFNVQHMTKRSIMNLYECIGYNDFENDRIFQQNMNKIINNVLYTCVLYNESETELNKRYSKFKAN